MGKTIKILLIALLLLLVVSSILSDLPIGQKLQQGLDLGLYLKLVSLLGLVIAAFVAWGFRSRVVCSQKYRRADEVMVKALDAFDRKKAACEQMETQLQEKYADKAKDVNTQIEQVRHEYHERLKVLKAQNIELKESVAKLMQTLKRERAQRS